MSATPTRKEMCATCPFRDGSPYGYLRDDLTHSALHNSSRICHSTGNNPVIKAVDVPEQLCRGARDVQLRYFCSIGFIKEPTDEAWNRRCEELGIPTPPN